MPDRGELLLMWANDKSYEDQSVTIVVPDGERHDFLAWSSTYVGTHSPFTSFFRVLEFSELAHFDLLGFSHDRLNPSILLPLCGAAIAEAAVQTNFKSVRPSSISLQSCQLTFSFAAIRALAAGYHPTNLIDLGQAWDNARRPLGSRVPPLSADRALSFWLLGVSPLQEEGDFAPANDTWMSLISSLVQATSQAGSDPLANVQWGQFDHLRPSMARFEDANALPRERQLRLLDEVVVDLRRSEAPVPLAEAILGYLLARISNGSFEYLALAADYRNDLPCCALWFSLFAIWQRGFDGLSIAGGLGRHVATTALVKSDILGRPSADVSLQEFLLLTERKSPGPLKSIFSSTIEVELIPGIASRFPNPARRAEEEPSRVSPSVDSARISRMLREALSLLEPRSASQDEPVLDDLFKSGSKAAAPKPRRARKKG